MTILLLLIFLTLTMVYMVTLPRIGSSYRENSSRALCYVTRIESGAITIEYSPNYSVTMPIPVFHKEFTRAN